jgi:GntR family transcriptional regulator, rspAB operon transcriptional repressor
VSEAPPTAPAPADDRLSKADRVYLAIKRAVSAGELAPGTPIDKTGLCVRFGVSRLPVTTAINRLAYEGLLIVEPQKGSFVARIRLDDVLQWMFVRRAVEVGLAGEAARRLPAETIEAMTRSLHYQEAAIAASDYDGLLELDVGFHQLPTDGLGLRRVAESLDALRTHLDRVRRLLLPEPDRMQTTLDEHRAIHAAIAARKPQAAERAMRRHLDEVVTRLVDFEHAHPDFFGP